MIEGRIIVSVGSSWDYDPTSKHQIMKILSRKNQIVWINYHGTRRPTLGRRDIGAACSAIGRVARGIRRISPSMVQMTPLVIPGARSRLLHRVHQLLVISQIRRAIASVDRTGQKPIQVWTFAPDVPFLIGQFNEECFLYYCVDEYRRFEGFDTARIAAWEDELLERSDLVITTSEQLLSSKRAIRPDVELVRHGVDYDHFAQSWRKRLQRPADLRGVRGPIFGFFGLIHNWVDVGLLAEVAALRPEYTFALLGECKIDVSGLRRRKNVLLLGRRPYHELPAYCAAFDAGMMFFAQNAMTRNINPIKMHEYLAAGLPIVSTPLPEARRYADLITFGATPQAFAEACDRVLARRPRNRGESVARVVEGESWLSKVEDLSDMVMKRLACDGRAEPSIRAPSASAACSVDAVGEPVACALP
ncbi:MAG: glycosyltransferase [Planctomycetes bacterium]|nr:glycosyltransferase [Planctomycetota bacterium]